MERMVRNRTQSRHPQASRQGKKASNDKRLQSQGAQSTGKGAIYGESFHRHHLL